MQGFMFPQTPSGRSSVIPPPPWHYSGEMLTVEYRTDPDRVSGLLPEGVEPATDDPGAVALIWADWQSCSDDFSELSDPVRSQYKECFAVVRCQWRDQTWSRCVFIWVDKDFALVRGYHQGYPKKLGSIWMTRPVALGRAGPRLESGGVFGASLAAGDRRLAEIGVTLEREVGAPGFVNGHAMLHNRRWPSIESDGTNSIDELVTMRGYDGEIGDVWSGRGHVEVFSSPGDELSILTPGEVIGAYYHRVAVSWRGGTTLERTIPTEVSQ
jgi:acetoacetate decarboxylase